MQATNVKKVSTAQRTKKTFNKTLIKPAEQLDVTLEKVVEPTNVPSFNRYLEAYSDCV